MQKILGRRVLRDLKKHFFRYFMLGIMITMGIFLVVTVVGSAETLTGGTEDIALETNLEDGEFEVFVPLKEVEIDHIEDMGISVSEQFYIDYKMNKEELGTIRLFKLREKINQIYYVSGSAPSDKSEIAIEKRYAYEHNITVGDFFEIAGKSYKISGIGVTSDYDGPLKEIADTSCNSEIFGLVFMKDEAYEEFKTNGNIQKSETYIYSYKLNGNVSDDDLKEYLKDLKIEASQVDDPLFQEYWDRTGGVEDELRNSVKELKDATNDVKDGLGDLEKNNDEINESTQNIFDLFLNQTEGTLNVYNLNLDLTEENYDRELENIISTQDNPAVTQPLVKSKKQLEDYKDYKDGIQDYTNGVGELYNGTSDMADGVADLDDSVNDMLEEMDFSLSNLTGFLKREDNPRIFATKNDKVVDIEVGIFAGAIIFILFAYVISVFVVHSIEKESSIIGTLYSMGVTKNNLLLHYITLPVVVTLISGTLGVIVASTGIMAPMIAKSSYLYFSIPEFSFKVPGYLWIYSILCPPIMAIIVNVIVLNTKLKRTALSLIRNEIKVKNGKRVSLKNLGFIRAYRIRQMIWEMRSTVAVVLGMFLALLIFMIAVNCYTLCSNLATDYENDTKYKYMYTLKYPEKEAPADTEAAYAYTCKKGILGYNFDITILGIDKDNKYFDVDTGNSRMDVVVSSAFAEKFWLKKGEEFIVTDEEKDVKYAFSVKDITTYSAGFFIFMDIDEMRDMMGETSDYYNVLFTDKEIEIDPGRVYSITGKDDIVKGTSVFTDLMMPLIYTLAMAAGVIFCVVLYLMMKVMIDRSGQNISVIKVFGYKHKEIRKLYLDGNFYIIAIGALIVLPLSKMIMNMMFPFMISNISCGLNVKTPIYFFLLVYAGVIALYFFINALLVKQLDKYTPAEILKNRE